MLVPELPAKSSVLDDDGRRWTMTVRASSVFRAVLYYNSQQRTGSQNYREYPRLELETMVEVKLPDGRSWTTTFGQVMASANRVADQQAARWKQRQTA